MSRPGTRSHRRLVERGLAEHELVGGHPARRALDAEPGAGVALGVEVDDQDLAPARRQRRAEIDRGRRLADAALLVDDGEHAGGVAARARLSLTRCCRHGGIR
jgi:hypothetical protein